MISKQCEHSTPYYSLILSLRVQNWATFTGSLGMMWMSPWGFVLYDRYDQPVMSHDGVRLPYSHELVYYPGIEDVGFSASSSACASSGHAALGFPDAYPIHFAANLLRQLEISSALVSSPTNPQSCGPQKT